MSHKQKTIRESLGQEGTKAEEEIPSGSLIKALGPLPGEKYTPSLQENGFPLVRRGRGVQESPIFIKEAQRLWHKSL